MCRKDIEGEAKGIVARCGDIPLYTGEEEEITAITGFRLVRGALCAMRRRELPSAEEISKGKKRIAVLENVVNPTNVGAIIRSAAALQMDAVLLTPGCADPLYRRAARVSVGTVFQVPWTIPDDQAWTWPAQGIRRLKEMGFATAAMALEKDSLPIDDPAPAAEKKLALIFGTEGEGLSAETVRQCDYTVMIPMSHGVDSLNVGAAAAVAFWQLGAKR